MGIFDYKDLLTEGQKKNYYIANLLLELGCPLPITNIIRNSKAIILGL